MREVVISFEGTNDGTTLFETHESRRTGSSTYLEKYTLADGVEGGGFGDVPIGGVAGGIGRRRPGTR